MTTMIKRAQSKGFAAEGMLSRYVLVSLTNRQASTLEVSFELNVPQSACSQSCWGVTIDMSKVN